MPDAPIFYITLAVPATGFRDAECVAEGLADAAEARIVTVSTDFAMDEDNTGQPVAYLGAIRV